jgi:hypothetical protein
MYMKKYIFLAASALTLASCTSDDFLGNTPGSTPTSANSAIKFDGNAGKISRATSNTASTPQGKLDYQFKIYGVKSGANNNYSKVFENYSIWYNTTKTTSNTNDWEYVAGAGMITTGETANPTKITLNDAQTIKYWDYASDNYHFVAGSPIENFDYELDQNGNIASAKIKGLGGHIEANSGTTATTFNPVYVAKPKVVAKTDYQKPVQFEFVRQQSMVRVGIYETIPGYKITDIKFYKQGENGLEKVDATNNIILTSTTPDYFVGGPDVTGTITYDWTTPGYTFDYTGTYTKDKNWYAGALTKGVEATTSTETTISKLYGSDGDMDVTNGYFIVMPTLVKDPSAILIKCDYTLKSEDKSGETIKVTGATAAIPAAYSKWDINTRYTYLFKISENTNGTTGNPDDKDPAGLYPITFNAAVTEMTDKTEGTTTTFTAPSITTYQKGSVEGNTIKYVANKNIDVTVLNDKAEVQTLKTTDEAAEQVGHIAVYKFDTEITEAEVQVKGVTGATKIEGSVDANNVFTFKPTAAGWYAIKYLAKAKVGTTPAVYTYKVVYVAAATK